MAIQSAKNINYLRERKLMKLFHIYKLGNEKAPTEIDPKKAIKSKMELRGKVDTKAKA